MFPSGGSEVIKGAVRWPLRCPLRGLSDTSHGAESRASLSPGPPCADGGFGAVDARIFSPGAHNVGSKAARFGDHVTVYDNSLQEWAADGRLPMSVG
jgi:hypothetical protein